MFHLILFQPEIPPNTGNIIRLCANTGTRLHLIRPLGFELEDRQLRRAGLDYREYAEIRVYEDLPACLAVLGDANVYALTTRGGQRYSESRFKAGDAFLLGPETRGLPAEVLDSLPAENCLRIPLQPDNRSLNLSNAAAIVVYEAWRQLGFDGGQ